MIVFFKNIPNDANRSEINALIKPAVKGGLFKAKGSLNSLEILALKDKSTKLVEYHALAQIEPEKVAMRVIKTLHGNILWGNRITVRPFQVRNPNNDRRKGENGLVSPFKDKRTNPDRRRDLEAYKVATPQYYGLSL
jgi:hypothetical protein